MTEVHKQSKPQSCSFQIIQNLRAMLVRQLLHRLQLDDYFLVAKEIRDITLFQLEAFVSEPYCRLRRERYLLQTEFEFQTLLINRLDEYVAFFLIHLEARADNRVTLLCRAIPF